MSMKIGPMNTIDFARVTKIPKFKINVKQGDSKRTIQLRLLTNGETLNLENYTVTVAAVKDDGTDIFNDVTIIDPSAGICEVEITEQMLVLNTDLPCEIVLYGADGTVASSSNFVISRISSARNEESIISSSEFTALTKALSDVTDIKNNINKKMNKGESISVSQIDRNKGKFDQTYMSDELLQQMAGNTPINTVPSDLSITTPKVANNAITPEKIYKRDGIILNGSTIEVNFQELKVKVLIRNLYITGVDGYIDLRPPSGEDLPVIPIPSNAINTSTYVQYSLWVSATTKSVNFTVSVDAPSDAIILANFYQGKPFVNNLGNGLIVINKLGERVDTSLTQLKDTVSKMIPNATRIGTVSQGTVNIISQDKKMIIDIRLLTLPTSYIGSLPNRPIELSYADMTNPDYAKFLYYDTSSNEYIILNTSSKVPFSYILILAYYNGQIIYSAPDRKNILINGKSSGAVTIDNDSTIDDGVILSSKIRRTLRPLINENSIEVNFQELKVKVLTTDTYYVTENGYVDMRGNGGQKLSDINIPPEALTEYVLWSLWFNDTDKTLRFTRSRDASNKGIELGRFYRGSSFLDNQNGGIKVVNAKGDVVTTSFGQITSTPSKTYFYSENVNFDIVYDKENYTITAIAKKGNWLIFDSGAINISADKEFVYQTTSDRMTYAFKLFVNKNDGTPKIIPHTSSLSVTDLSIYAFVCIFSNNGLYTPSFSPKVISIDGKTPKAIASIGGSISDDSSYDWDNNRFIIPNDLYLVKNIPYTLLPSNFNLVQFTDNDDILYEMALPTKIEQFEQSIDIQIPFAFEKGKPYRTKITGKYKKHNSMLTKDIYLHVADTTKVSKTDIKVLCIGDSITHSNFPKHLKWQLSQMGVNATMLGTQSNSHESYSYGISQYLPMEKGEGRGGWRLTDFCCNTPLIGGGVYENSGFPMMNPSTKRFDFSYYMQNQGFTDVDFVVINLGTNDISGYHYAGSSSTNPAYNTIRKVDLTNEYLNPESEYYLGNLYSTLIDSIHEFNPNIKIAINPPMTSGTSNFIVSSMKWAEVVQYALKDKPNVYHLGSYLGQGQLSVANIEGNKDLVTVDTKNTTQKLNYIHGDVHPNGMGQLIHTLYPASWIVNMCL